MNTKQQLLAIVLVLLIYSYNKIKTTEQLEMENIVDTTTKVDSIIQEKTTIKKETEFKKH